MADGEKRFPMTVIVGMIVLGLLLAGGISYYIATYIVAEKSDKKVHEPGEFVKLGDPKEGLILNVGGVNNSRFLKISIVLEMKSDKKSSAKEGKNLSPEEVKILDTAVQVLRSQKIENYEASRQEALKETLKTELNRVLGEERVYQVYITNFVLQ